MTWNLWWRNGPWQQRREAIAATLAELDPDICGLQEVWAIGAEQAAGTASPDPPAEPAAGDAPDSTDPDSTDPDSTDPDSTDPDSTDPDGSDPDSTDPEGSGNFAADLAARLGRHWCWAGRPTSSGRQDPNGAELLFGNAVLSRWPITARAELPLPVPAGQRRLVLHTLIDTPGGTLPFFTTHFSHQAGASLTRQAQVRALAGFVAGHAADHPYPPVITGDLNAQPDSDEIRLLCGVLTAPAMPGQVLVDAWRYAEAGQAGMTWDHRNPYLASDPDPDARIDYLLVGRRREGPGRIRSVRIAGDRPVDGIWPSDHFAVVAELD